MEYLLCSANIVPFVQEMTMVHLKNMQTSIVHVSLEKSDIFSVTKACGSCCWIEMLKRVVFFSLVLTQRKKTPCTLIDMQVSLSSQECAQFCYRSLRRATKAPNSNFSHSLLADCCGLSSTCHFRSNAFWDAKHNSIQTQRSSPDCATVHSFSRW